MTDPVVRTLEQASPKLNRENPWPGLASFSEDQAEFFYGREREVEDLFRRVRLNTLSVLYGQSGMGKTSLVHAALFPRLRGAGYLPVPIRIDWSPKAPAARIQIYHAIGDAIAVAEGSTRKIGEQESLWEYLHRGEPAATDASGRPLTVVLAFDQFEEMFTFGYEGGDVRGFARDFIEELGSLSEHRPPTRVEAEFERDPRRVADFDFDRQEYRLLLSLREDFLAHLHDLSVRIPSITVNNMRLTPLDGIRALEVVERPGKGLIAPGAAEDIVRVVADAADERRDDTGPRAGDSRPKRPIESLEVEPSLLSLFCQRLNQYRGDGLITRALVAARREKILSEFYESSLEDQHPGVRLFIEEDLVTAKGFRQTLSLDSAEVKLAEYGAPVSALTVLVGRRLLQSEHRGRVNRIELAHDVLTRVVLESRNKRQAKEAEEARRREAEESERRAEAAQAAAEAELARVRNRQRVTWALLGVVAIAAAAAVGFALQARNSNRDLLLTQKGLKDSTMAAQLARQQADANSKRADSLRFKSDSNRITAEKNLAAANAERARSDTMLDAFCTYGLQVINRFGDSTSGRKELTAAYYGLIEISDKTVEKMLKFSSRDSRCPRRLDSRTESIAVGLQYEMGKTDSAIARGHRALERTRLLARFSDSVSRHVAAQSFADITYQLWRLDANDSAVSAARAGIPVSRSIDPGNDSSALHRLARTYHYGSAALLDMARTKQAEPGHARLIAEAGRMADSGLAVVERGLNRKDQRPSRIDQLYIQSQLWFRKGQVDSALKDTTGALAAFRSGVQIARAIHDTQKTTGSRRWRAISHASLGNLALQFSRLDEADVAFDSAVVDWTTYAHRYRQLGDLSSVETGFEGVANSLLGKARVAARRDQPDRAIALGRRAIDSASVGYRVQRSPAAGRTLSATYNLVGDLVESFHRPQLADSFYFARIRTDSLVLAGDESPDLAEARNYERGAAKLLAVLRRREDTDTVGAPVAERPRILRALEQRRLPLLQLQLLIRRNTERMILRSRDSLARRAVLDDSVSSALGDLSWTQLLIGQPEQAVESAKEAMRLGPAQTYILPNYFNALVMAGRDEEAAVFLQANATRLVERDPVPLPCAAIRDIRALRAREAATDRHVQVVERLVAQYPTKCPLPTPPTQ